MSISRAVHGVHQHWGNGVHAAPTQPCPQQEGSGWHLTGCTSVGAAGQLGSWVTGSHGCTHSPPFMQQNGALVAAHLSHQQNQVGCSIHLVHRQPALHAAGGALMSCTTVRPADGEWTPCLVHTEPILPCSWSSYRHISPCSRSTWVTGGTHSLFSVQQEGLWGVLCSIRQPASAPVHTAGGHEHCCPILGSLPLRQCIQQEGLW